MSLRLEIDGRIARLLIDRADKRNAFNLAMWQQLPDLVAAAVADSRIRVIVLTSAEPGLFAAGADIAEMLANKDDAEWLVANQAAINRAQFVLTRAEKPTIAFIDGDAIGGGCALAMACDVRLLTERARMGITPAKLGLVYPLHDTKLLVDLVGPGRAKLILFSGALLNAEEALRIGLADQLVESADVLTALIAGNSLYSTRIAKSFVRRILDGQNQDDAATLAVFAEAFSGPDFHEGASAFTEKRRPAFP